MKKIKKIPWGNIFKITILLAILSFLLWSGYHLFIKKDMSFSNLLFWKKVDSKTLVKKLKKIVEKKLDKYVSDANFKETYRLRMSGESAFSKETSLDEDIKFEKKYTFSFKLFFPDNDFLYLSSETRAVSVSSEDILTLSEAVIKELIKGPRLEGLSRAISPKAKLRAIYFNKGILYLDFYRTLNDRYHLGSSGEIMLIYSIVNTLCQFEQIKKVKFLIDGKEQATFRTNHLCLDDFFTPKKDFLKQ